MARYIDADKIPRHGKRGGECYWQEIEQLPTADVRENVRGEWVQHDCGGFNSIDKDTCSVCKETFYQISETGCIWNYCPNCGADMRPISALSENVEIVSNLKRGES